MSDETNNSVGETPNLNAEVQNAQPQQVVLDPNNLSDQQKVAILRSVHQFFANYDRVPGTLASNWGNALDALAIVCNALNNEVLQAAASQS